MLEIFKEFFPYFLSGLILVLDVLILLLKRRPQIIDEGFVAKVCQWILDAENKFKLGSDKLDFVLDKCKEHLGSSYDYAHVRALIEYILTIPQKKGVSNEK